MTDAPKPFPLPGDPIEYANQRLAAEQPPDPIFHDVSELQTALLAALAKASKQFDRIGKDSKGSVAAGSAFKYADIAAINKATRAAEGALADCGVVVMQPLMPSPLGEGWSRITTIIAGHGATMSFPYDLRLSEMAAGVRAPSTPQKMGAVLTYMRRYLLQSALNLAGDADLDELPQEQGKQKQGVPPVQAKPQQRAPRSPPAPRKQAPKNRPVSAKPPPHDATVREALSKLPATPPGTVARPVVARPTVVTMASRPAAPPDHVDELEQDMPTEPPHPADTQEAPDFSLRADGDTQMGEESEVTITFATAAQKKVLGAEFKRVGIKQRSKIDAFISGVVPGANAKTIVDNGAHAQAVIDAMTQLADAS